MFRKVMEMLNVASSNDEGVITPIQAQNLVKESGALLIDVREADECKAGGLASSAVNVPLQDENFKSIVLELADANEGAPVILMCLSGMRSKKAYDQLSASTDIPLLKIEGGINRWREDGLPIKES